MTFSTHKQKIPSEKAVVWTVHCIKLVYYVFFAAQIRFCCESD